jgi:hypothetical protein
MIKVYISEPPSDKIAYRVDFEGKQIKGNIFEDGSGELEVKSNIYNIWQEDATHKLRVKEIRKLHKQLGEALKELDQLESKLDSTKLNGKKLKNYKTKR